MPTMRWMSSKPSTVQPSTLVITSPGLIPAAAAGIPSFTVPTVGVMVRTPKVALTAA